MIETFNYRLSSTAIILLVKQLTIGLLLCDIVFYSNSHSFLQILSNKTLIIDNDCYQRTLKYPDLYFLILTRQFIRLFKY